MQRVRLASADEIFAVKLFEGCMVMGGTERCDVVQRLGLGSKEWFV